MNLNIKISFTGYEPAPVSGKFIKLQNYMMSYYCYFNGRVLKKERIRVNITDLAMARGYAVFDYLRTYNGIPFRIKDYLSRFENSASAMNLKIPASRKQIIEIIYELFKKNKLKPTPPEDVGIRFLLTGGYAEDVYTINRPNFFILIEDLPKYPNWQFTKGIKLNLWEHQRELPLVKTTNYLTAIKLAALRKKLNVQDTLYYSNNNILECTRNNFFLFHGNTLVTAGDHVLEGITRKTVLELASDKFKIEVRGVLVSELDECTECFITGSTRGVCPVININKKIIAKGRQGGNTKMLMNLFNKQKIIE